MIESLARVVIAAILVPAGLVPATAEPASVSSGAAGGSITAVPGGGQPAPDVAPPEPGARAHKPSKAAHAAVAPRTRPEARVQPRATTRASWYRTRTSGLTTAHRTLAMGTRLQVCTLDGSRCVEVSVTDRGPFIAGRDLDLSREAFAQLARPSRGVIDVTFRLAN